MTDLIPPEQNHRGCAKAVYWADCWMCATCTTPRSDTFGLERYATYRPETLPPTGKLPMANHTGLPIQVSFGRTAQVNPPFAGFASYGKHPFLLQNVPPIARQNERDDQYDRQLALNSLDQTNLFEQQHVKAEVEKDFEQPFIKQEYEEAASLPAIGREEPGQLALPQHRIKREPDAQRRRSRSPDRGLVDDKRPLSPLQETLNHPVRRRIPVPCKRCKAAGKISRNHFDHECKYLDEKARDEAWERFLRDAPW